MVLAVQQDGFPIHIVKLEGQNHTCRMIWKRCMVQRVPEHQKVNDLAPPNLGLLPEFFVFFWMPASRLPRHDEYVEGGVVFVSDSLVSMLDRRVPSLRDRPFAFPEEGPLIFFSVHSGEF